MDVVHKGLVPKLPKLKRMLEDPNMWVARLTEVNYPLKDLLQETYRCIDDMTDMTANKKLKDMAEGLEDRCGEHGAFFWALEKKVRKKHDLLEDQRKSLFYPELRDAKGKKTKRALMNEHEKEKDNVWLWFNEVVWNVEKVRMLKKESSYSEPEDYSKKEERE
jgi:hypothetical protein